MAAARLHELSEHGVSVWIDSLSREMLETGELARLMADDRVVGHQAGELPGLEHLPREGVDPDAHPVLAQVVQPR